MDWSLGELADQSWSRLPELRPIIAQMAIAELNEAIEEGRDLERVSAYWLASELYRSLLRPALDAFPQSRDVLARACTVLRSTLESDSTNQSLDADAVQHRIVGRLSFGADVPKIAEVDPILGDLLKGRFRQMLLN